MIDLQQHAEGTILPVRAHAGARKTAIRDVQNGALKVAVTQIAEKGKANKAIVQLLCKSLGLRRSQVTLIAGDTSPQKKFLVRDMEPATLEQRIRQTMSQKPGA